jgi:signal peptidase I
MAEAASQGPVISNRRKIIGAIILLIVGAAFWQFASGKLTSYTIQGDSMAPTLQEGERVLVARTLDDEEFGRGEIVVFPDPRPQFGAEMLVKRIVALEGDRIVVRSHRLHVNGVPEWYLDLGEPRVNDLDDLDLIVPPGQLYVLGDNRPVSYDSTEFGFLGADAIIGKIAYRYAPWSRHGEVE